MNMALTTAVAITEAQRAKARRVRLIAAGVCFVCAQAEAVTPSGMCAGCAGKNALRAWLRYQPKRGRYGRRTAG